jgi:hypothetical protein
MHHFQKAIKKVIQEELNYREIQQLYSQTKYEQQLSLLGAARNKQNKKISL